MPLIFASLARKRTTHLLLAGVSAATVTGIVLYYLLIPAWILIMRFDYDDSLLPQIDNRIKIADDDLADLPALRQAIAQADRDYPFGHTPAIWASYLEGREIVERFEMAKSYPAENSAVDL